MHMLKKQLRDPKMDIWFKKQMIVWTNKVLAQEANRRLNNWIFGSRVEWTAQQVNIRLKNQISGWINKYLSHEANKRLNIWIFRTAQESN